MSLMDYLNNDTLSSASSSSTSAQISQLLQQAQAKQGATTETTSTSSTASTALISAAAKRAAASAEDSKKDAAALVTDIRATLDKQKTDGAKTPGVSSFSARALSIIALNEDGKFSKAEIAAAKMELRERDRAAALSFLNSGELTATSLKGYSQQLLAAREAMSKEERQLRDTDKNLR